MKDPILYPYLPEDREILYVSQNNPFMAKAKEVAKGMALDNTMPTASVLVKSGKILHFAANGSDYHKTHKCKRVELKIPTGEGYELCEGCHPKHHSERKVIEEAIDRGMDLRGADLYLWGHFWCCESCWKAIEEARIENVFLLEGSETLFNKNNKNNIVGRQFM